LSIYSPYLVEVHRRGRLQVGLLGEALQEDQGSLLDVVVLQVALELEFQGDHQEAHQEELLEAHQELL
jgi:hypothetical protein